MTKVRIENLQKSYGKLQALNGLSLNLEPGTLTAVLGPSGCGKTTLLRALGGFLEVDGGQIFFGNTEVTKLPPQDRGAALVFQNYALWPHMSVYENVAYGLKLKKFPKDRIDSAVRKIVELVGLDSDALEKGRKPTQLSGGQQQRVALARALVIEPSLLLLDEPLSNLDAKVRSRLRVYIREIQQKVGITALYVTHDQEEALSIADIIVVMNRGKIMQIGTPQEIYSNPSNLFVAEFIGDSTILHGIINTGGKPELAGSIITGIPIHADNEGKIQPGDNINIVMRAADLNVLGKNEQIPKSDEVLRLDAHAESSMFIGSEYKNIITFNGQTIFADCDRDYSGQDVQLTIPKDRIRIFK